MGVNDANFLTYQYETDRNQTMSHINNLYDEINNPLESLSFFLSNPPIYLTSYHFDEDFNFVKYLLQELSLFLRQTEIKYNSFHDVNAQHFSVIADAVEKIMRENNFEASSKIKMAYVREKHMRIFKNSDEGVNIIEQSFPKIHFNLISVVYN